MLRHFKFANGESFREPADWVEFARDALMDRAIYPTFDMRPDDDYGGPDRRLFDLYDALRGTGAEALLADGILRVMEAGAPAERYRARLGPYERAPDAELRLARLISHDRVGLIEARLLRIVLGRLLMMKHVGAVELLHEELRKPDSPDLGLTAIEHDFDGFVERLPPYRAQFDPQTWLYFMRNDHELTPLLDAMVHDPGYARRLRDDYLGTGLTDEERAKLQTQLATHPIARTWLDAP